MRLLFCILFLWPITMRCQNWVSVDSGFNQNVVSIFTDTVQDKLIAIGNFSIAGGSVPARFVARYDGHQWDSIPILNHIWPGFHYAYYNNKIIFGWNEIYSWDGASLNSIGHFNGSVEGFCWYLNQFIAFGSFDSINGNPISCLARWDGNSWSALDTTRWSSPGFYCAREYKGDLYVGGNTWAYYNGTLIERLARWDGQSWNKVGNGVTGSVAFVGSFEEFQGDLYIGGGFAWGNGMPSSCLARWDGSQYKDVRGGLDTIMTNIYDMVVYDSSLIVCGGFSHNIEGVPMWCVGRWDGNRWCNFGIDTINCWTQTLAVYRNELYLAGCFSTIGGDSINFIAKWTDSPYPEVCGTSVALEEENLSKLILSPNPSSGPLSLELSLPFPSECLVQLSDLSGKIIRAEQHNSQGISLFLKWELSDLPAGMYLLKVKTDVGEMSKKWVKE